MEYWKGTVDWPISPDWKCQTCGTKPITVGNSIIAGLTWGFVNGTFRCDECHTQYSLREGQTILPNPTCRLKSEYVDKVKLAWTKYHTPIDELTYEQWEDLS